MPPRGYRSLGDTGNGQSMRNQIELIIVTPAGQSHRSSLGLKRIASPLQQGTAALRIDSQAG